MRGDVSRRGPCSSASMPNLPFLRELAGFAVGWLWAPPIAAIAAVRRSRMFHPDGIVVAAHVESAADPGDSDLVRVAERLSGPAIVRFSSALWKGEAEWPDALGCAVRFGADEARTVESGDQDLLFATILSPLTMAFSPLTTAVHDYLANTYFAVAPFDVPGVGRAKWRLCPEAAVSPESAPKGRAEKLRAAVASHVALRLELRRTWTRGWRPVARVVLDREIAADQAGLRFSPFRVGRGIEPRGFVHALRRGAYAASQAARPRHDRAAPR